MSNALLRLTTDWGQPREVALYLERCQVDTPPSIVREVWSHVMERRPRVGRVVDFGAGDCRFARGAVYDSYVGFEVDPARSAGAVLPRNARIEHKCAFSPLRRRFDVSVGNPPFVRNQDLPASWRERAARVIHARTGAELSGLANAWQYFFFLSLISVGENGLVALVVPYEWVSRPSSRTLREYIQRQGWSVSVYRLPEASFAGVMTTSSITVIDKADRSGAWQYFATNLRGAYASIPSPSGSAAGILPFRRRSDRKPGAPFVQRGASPGSQEALTLTNAERLRHGLKMGRDVVPCVTTLRYLPDHIRTLTPAVFDAHFRDASRKCWLIRSDRTPSDALRRYLASVPADARQTATCANRAVWWQFLMPPVPRLVVATGFRGARPKCLRNPIGARVLGGVAGVHGVSDRTAQRLQSALLACNLEGRLVAHATGLKKIEIAQLEALVYDLLSVRSPTTR